MSRIRTNIITNRMVDWSTVVSTGLRVTGVCTATSFSGDGSNLSGLASREVYGFTGIGKSLSLTTQTVVLIILIIQHTLLLKKALSDLQVYLSV